MGNFRAWLHRLGANISAGLRGFMMGRYGNDKLNVVILAAGLVVCIVELFIPLVPLRLVLTLLSYCLLGWALFRSFSRNTYQRYQENRRFGLFLDRLRDREHRYYTCPKCKQTIRVPRGKGKISITCPKCREKFIKKT